MNSYVTHIKAQMYTTFNDEKWNSLNAGAQLASITQHRWTKRITSYISREKEKEKVIGRNLMRRFDAVVRSSEMLTFFCHEKKGFEDCV